MKSYRATSLAFVDAQTRSLAGKSGARAGCRLAPVWIRVATLDDSFRLVAFVLIGARKWLQIMRTAARFFFCQNRTVFSLFL